jgi:hypothetical protein
MVDVNGPSGGWGCYRPFAGVSASDVVVSTPGEWTFAQDVIDQLALALENPGEKLVLDRDLRGQVPQPRTVALVGVVEPAGTEL